MDNNNSEIAEIPSLSRLFSTDDLQNNKEVEVRTQCFLNKTKLDFGLSKQLFQVTLFEQSEPSFSETITLQNNSGRDYLWQLVQAQKSKKYSVEAFPSSGKVKAKKSCPIVIKFRIFCTTRTNVKLGIMLAQKQQRTIFSKPKEAPTMAQDVLMFTFRAESDLSASIDYDELQTESKIASGGFGTVYKGTYRGLDVAIKKLHVQELTPEDKEIFYREIELMRRLTCQYVVTLLGSTQIPGQPLCLVMEYIKGGALTNLLTTRRSDKLKCKIILDIAIGMSFLHKSNIFHRDLKPDNVLVISDSEDAAVNIKITDFDTARTLLQDSNHYQQNYQSFMQAAKKTQEEIRTLSNMGTLIYKAPELMPPNIPDPNLIDKTDVFSYGVLTYHLFTQQEPYTEEPYKKFSGSEIERFVKDGNRLPIPTSVPKDISELISSCWQQKARLRPSMDKIVSDLRAVLPQMSSDVDKEFVPPEEQHQLIGWMGSITREVAEQGLTDAPDGTFLIRWSSRAKSYVMSHKAPSKVEHIADIIANPDKTITVVKSNNERKSFRSLIEYIEAMKKMKVITTPLAITPPSPVPENYIRTPTSNYVQQQKS